MPLESRQHTVWVLAVRRQDKKAPTVYDIVNDEFFLDRDRAEKELRRYHSEKRVGVYRVLLTIMECVE